MTPGKTDMLMDELDLALFVDGPAWSRFQKKFFPKNGTNVIIGMTASFDNRRRDNPEKQFLQVTSGFQTIFYGNNELEPQYYDLVTIGNPTAFVPNLARESVVLCWLTDKDKIGALKNVGMQTVEEFCGNDDIHEKLKHISEYPTDGRYPMLLLTEEDARGLDYRTGDVPIALVVFEAFNNYRLKHQCFGRVNRRGDPFRRLVDETIDELVDRVAWLKSVKAIIALNNKHNKTSIVDVEEFLRNPEKLAKQAKKAEQKKSAATKQAEQKKSVTKSTVSSVIQSDFDHVEQKLKEEEVDVTEVEEVDSAEDLDEEVDSTKLAVDNEIQDVPKNQKKAARKTAEKKLPVKKPKRAKKATNKKKAQGQSNDSDDEVSFTQSHLTFSLLVHRPPSDPLYRSQEEVVVDLKEKER